MNALNNNKIFPALLMRLFYIFTICCTVLGTTACGSGGDSSTGGGASGGTSVAGSTATMAIYQNTLYSLINHKLVIVDLDNEIKPQTIVAYNAETVYVYQHYLYIAGRSSVTIYDISNPLSPLLTSNYPHARGCDPVIVDNHIGYITLRNRSGCEGDINRLEVVDFSDPKFPQKITDFTMDSPYGLAKTPDYLAVCQQSYGLTLLNVDNISAIKEITRYPQFNCFDLLYKDNILVVTAADGIYQLDATDEFLVELSRIPIGI